MRKISKFLSCILAAAVLLSVVLITPVSAAKLKKPSVKIENTDSGVKLSWRSVKGAKKYIVSRKLSNAKKLTAIKTVRLHSFIDKKAKSGKKYTYTVTAVGSGKKTASKGKSILCLNTPKNLKVKFVGVSDDEDDLELESWYSAKLSWKKVKGAKRYEIQRVKITGSNIGLYKKIGYSSSTSFMDDDVLSGSYYKYKIRAVNGKDKSAFTAATKKNGFLEPVYLYVGSASDYSAVKISWMGSAGADGYKLYKSTDRGKTYTLLKNSKTFKKSDGDYYYDDNDVKVGNYYYYYIEAYNSKMTSDKSNKASLYFKDYDAVVEKGKSKTETELSQVYNSIKYAAQFGVDIKAEFSSDDESIAKVEVVENDDKSYNVTVTGVTEGYTYIRVTLSANGQSETLKKRIKVSAQPVYDITLKKGETDKIYELNGDGGSLDNYDDSFLNVNVTSGNTDIVKVNNPSSKDFSLTGVSAGKTEISVKIFMEVENIEQTIMNQTFSVLVTE